jgi:hypothetical protein
MLTVTCDVNKSTRPNCCKTPSCCNYENWKNISFNIDDDNNFYYSKIIFKIRKILKDDEHSTNDLDKYSYIKDLINNSSKEVFYFDEERNCKIPFFY